MGANKEKTESVEKSTTTITNSEAQKLSEALKDLLYGSLSSDSAMKLLKSTLAICEISDSLDKAQKRIIKGFRTDEYNSLMEKVSNKEATPEENSQFEKLNSNAVNKSNDLISKLMDEEIEVNILKLNPDEFEKLREANKQKVTNGNFMLVFKWLC